jgi:hypothetical protein
MNFGFFIISKLCIFHVTQLGEVVSRVVFFLCTLTSVQ